MFDVKLDWIDGLHITRVLKLLLLVAVALAVVLIGWANYTINTPDKPPVNVSVPATPAPEVKLAPKIPVKVKKPVKVYSGGAALKDGLHLPAVVVDDQDKQVIASSQVKADDHPQTVTTLINTETGESETYVKRDPLPWIAWSDRGSVGMYAGIKSGEPTVRLQAHQELFTVKAIRFGAVASVDQPINGPAGTDYFVGVGLEYRF